MLMLEGGSGFGAAIVPIWSNAGLACLAGAAIVATVAVAFGANPERRNAGPALVIAGNLILVATLVAASIDQTVAAFAGLLQLGAYLCLAKGLAVAGNRAVYLRWPALVFFGWFVADRLLVGHLAAQIVLWGFVEGGASLLAARSANFLRNAENRADGGLIRLWLVTNAARAGLFGLAGLMPWPTVAIGTLSAILALLAIVGWSLALLRRQAQGQELRIDAYEARLANALRLDPLTGAVSRLGLLEEAERGFATWRRHKRALSVLAIDLDNFRAFNDAHGRDVGDALLRALFDAARRQLRAEDLVARVGGEEFVILLPETDYTAAVLTAERLGRRLGEVTVRAGDRRIGVTASIGVAAATAGDTAVSAVIDRAGRALSMVRGEGGGRVVGLHADGSTLAGPEAIVS